MMPPVSQHPLTDIADCSLEWLRAALTTNDYNFGPSIRNVSAEPAGGPNSTSARLTLTYGPGRDSSWPNHLFLKLSGGPDSSFGDTEVRYYTELGANIPHAPLPKCYHAAYAPESRRYHLLLEDLSASHEPNWEKVPTLEQAYLIAEAFAHLHAFWWDKPELPTVVAPLPNDEILERYLQPARNGLAALLEAIQDRVTADELILIQRVFERHPALLLERARQGRHFTCIHGDPNPGNILSPFNGSGRCYLIDRQPFDWSLQTWTGASDLAYMMVHWWEPATRAKLEVPILRHYLSQLQIRRVTGYGWEDLWLDYRLAAMQSFYVVAGWCGNSQEMSDFEWVWWPQLQKTLRAARDLRCAELLQ